jgi:hypothetical protein
MTVYNSDVLRLEGMETGIHGAQRNLQDGFATDTRKFIHKYGDGSIEKFIPESLLVLWGSTGIQGQAGSTGPVGAGSTGAQGDTGLMGPTGIYNDPERVYNGYGDVSYDSSGGTQSIIIGYTGATEYNELYLYNDLSVWNGGETGGIRIDGNGTLQMRMINDSGGPIGQGYLLKAKTDTHDNGVDIAEEDCENVIGLQGGDAVIVGDPFWMDVFGKSNARFVDCDVTGLSGGQAWKGLPFSVANSYGYANEGRAKAWTGINGDVGNAMGYCLEDSPDTPSNISSVFINKLPNGISGRVYVPIQGFSDVSTCPVEYHKNGNVVTIKLDDFLHTSDEVYIQFTDWPEKLRPIPGTRSSDIGAVGVFVDNGTTSPVITAAHWHYTNSGQCELRPYAQATLYTFVDLSTKGWQEPISFTYVL